MSVERLADDVASYMASGSVKRYHTVPMRGQQTDAEHSARALTLLLLIYPIVNGVDPAIELIKAMLWHDNAERVVGDVPAPVLRANDDYRQMYYRLEKKFFTTEQVEVSRAIDDLDADQTIWLKAMDRLELVIYCEEQQWLGNRHAKIIGDRCANYMVTDESTPTLVKDLVVHFVKNGIRSFA